MLVSRYVKVYIEVVCDRQMQVQKSELPCVLYYVTEVINNVAKKVSFTADY